VELCLGRCVCELVCVWVCLHILHFCQCMYRVVLQICDCTVPWMNYTSCSV